MFVPLGKRRSSWILSVLLSGMVASAFFLVSKGKAASPVTKTTGAVASSTLGVFAPTFAGPAATGCDFYGCSLLTGPFFTPSTASLPSTSESPALSSSPRPHAMPLPTRPRGSRPLQAGAVAAAAAVVSPTVSCEPLRAGCDAINSSSGGAVGVKGLNAVDSARQSTNVTVGDIEPADQGVCAGNGYVVETNNIGKFWFSTQRCSGNPRSSPWTQLWDSRVEDGAAAAIHPASSIMTTADIGSLPRLSPPARKRVEVLFRVALRRWPMAAMKALPYR